MATNKWLTLIIWLANGARDLYIGIYQYSFTEHYTSHNLWGSVRCIVGGYNTFSNLIFFVSEGGVSWIWNHTHIYYMMDVPVGDVAL